MWWHLTRTEQLTRTFIFKTQNQLLKVLAFFFFFPVCYQNISFISVLAALRNLYKKKKGLKQCLVPVINGLIFFQISISGTWIHNLDIQDQSYLRAAKIEFFFLSIWGI